MKQKVCIGLLSMLGSLGEMEVLINVDDPQTYTKPWTVKLGLRLMPDTDLIEDVCDNEKDNDHTLKK